MEWAKGRARAMRWAEEVVLLKEEMRRVGVTLEWQADWWEDRAGPWDGLDASMVEGVKGYALRQASIQRALAADFALRWAAPLAQLDGEGVDIGPVYTQGSLDTEGPDAATGEGPDEDADAAADEDDEYW